MNRVPFVNLNKEYTSIKKEINAAIGNVFSNSSFILGPSVSAFEKEFAQICGVKYCVGVNCGTSALHLALIALGIGPGDEVITVPNSFVSTTDAISYTGALPVFVDIEKDTFNIDVDRIKSSITQKTKALLPVHLYGHSADMESVLNIAREHNLVVIEDACQSHNAKYKGKKVESFYPSKNLGAYGCAGCVTTNDGQLAEKIHMLRNHGQPKKYYHNLIGYNYVMDGIQGAVLSTKLKYLNKWTKKRRGLAQLYNKLLDGIPNIILPIEKDYAYHVYHLYVIRVLENRDKLKEYLRKKGIETGIHYPIPIHLQKSYSFLNIGSGSFPISESYANEIISLPLHHSLTKRQIKYVANTIKNFPN